MSEDEKKLAAREHELVKQFPYHGEAIPHMMALTRFDPSYAGVRQMVEASLGSMGFNCPMVLRPKESWPAVQKWNFDYLKQKGAGKKVLVSLAIEEREKTQRVLMPVENYFEQISSGENNFCYMKEIPLEKFSEDLAEDLKFEECFPDDTYYKHQYLWVGNSQAVTGLHNDDEDNVVAQVYGHKRFVLYPPKQGENLYPNDKYDIGTVCCDVDPERPNYQLYPSSKIANDKAFVVTLEPGDLLVIPKYWWHQVRSLDNSISVNCFASTTLEKVRGEISRGFYEFLHHGCGYHMHQCVCHNAEGTVDLDEDGDPIYPPNSYGGSWFRSFLCL
jgi:hypothetical protein